MGTTHATLYRNPKQVYPWQVVGIGSSAHVVSNTWADEPKCYLLETDNAVAARYAYAHTPKDGQNPNISTYWECWFKAGTPASDIIYFTICNQSIIQVASATIRGYCIKFDCNLSQIEMMRIDGAGALVSLGSWPFNTSNLVHARISREVSGANRFWRLYMSYGPELNLVSGPSATDATYTNFSYWGWDLLSTVRAVFGGESCQS